MTNAKVTVYHKPTCTTCRKLWKLLEAQGIDARAVDYFLEPLGRDDLARVLRKAGLGPQDVLRARAPEYKALGLKDSGLSDGELLDLLAEHPNLLERPIVVRGARAVLARPVERVLELF